MSKYQEWIAANVTRVFGECAEVTEQMAAAFSELRRVRGHYYCWVWGERAHWWLVAPDGSIVDPTASQFPSKGAGEYVGWDGSPLPTNPCANCGGPVYDGNTVCSEDCHRAYVAYCSNPIGL